MKLSYIYEILVSVLMALFICVAAPVKSDTRPLLRKEDILVIKVKGNIGVIIVNVVYFFVSEKIRTTIFMSLLLLFIDGIVAARVKGFYGLRRR